MDNMGNAVEQQLPAKTSGLAIASLVLGICSFCTVGIGGVLGLIFGIVALSAIKKSAGRLAGNGLALAGIIVSCVSFMFVLMFVLVQVAILMPAFMSAKSQAMSVMSQNNMKQLSLVALMYCEDNDGNLPPSENWPEAMRKYYKDDSILISPFEPEAGRGYAMNSGLDGLNIYKIKRGEETVLFFECRPGSPPGGGRELLPEQPRAGQRMGYNIAFLDWHIERVPQERLDELIWEP